MLDLNFWIFALSQQLVLINYKKNLQMLRKKILEKNLQMTAWIEIAFFKSEMFLEDFIPCGKPVKFWWQTIVKTVLLKDKIKENYRIHFQSKKILFEWK